MEFSVFRSDLLNELELVQGAPLRRKPARERPD